jgi:hypothetical protein
MGAPEWEIERSRRRSSFGPRFLRSKRMRHIELIRVMRASTFTANGWWGALQS